MNISAGLVVYDNTIRRRVMEKLPFMATENIMMRAVAKGANRQQLHERLRVHSQAAATRVKKEGGTNDLTDRICSDEMFCLTRDELEAVLDPALYTGRSASQVQSFITNQVLPLAGEEDDPQLQSQLKV